MPAVCAIELSSSSWVIAYRLPANNKAKVHRLEAGDGAGLLAFIASLRHRLDPSDDTSALVVSCFEAGRDGFWLHRLLSAHGVINHVVEPTSILVTRGPARQNRSAGRFRPPTRPCRKIRRRSRCLPDRGRAVRGRGRREAAASGAGIPGAGARAHRKSHRRVARRPGRSGEAVSPFLGRRYEGS